MNVRRTLAVSAASLAVILGMSIGVAGPASASDIVIPDCAHVLSDPTGYFDAFASINGEPAVAFAPTPTLYGSAQPILKRYLHAFGATNCSWHLAQSGVTRNFTVSEAVMNSTKDRLLRRWMAAHGIVGTDEEPILGGIAYQVGPHEWSLLMHGRVWISIIERGTSVFGYTLQSASYEIVDLNPDILVGTL